MDAPGETLSFVLMEKLPFPLLIEPVHRARAEQLVQQGKSEFDDYMLPLMLLQFKQGFGRLLRREDDQGAVVLLIGASIASTIGLTFLLRYLVTCHATRTQSGLGIVSTTPWHTFFISSV